MDREMTKRLLRVATYLRALQKVADVQDINNTAKASVPAMKRVLMRLQEYMVKMRIPPASQKALMGEIHKIVAPVGVVNQESADHEGGKLQYALKAAREHAPGLAPAVGQALVVAVLTGKVQNADLIQAAMSDPDARRQYNQFRKSMASALVKFEELLSKVDLTGNTDEEAAPLELQNKKDSTPLESYKKQLTDLDSKMNSAIIKVVNLTGMVIKDRIGDEALRQAMSLNLGAVFDGKNVSPNLLRDKDLYQEVLMLQEASNYDLRDLLESSKRKHAYKAYRSLVMAFRAWGMVQYIASVAKETLTNKKAHSMVRNAEGIVAKRLRIVREKLSAIVNEEDESEPAEEQDIDQQAA